jgi:hypothetical protein
MITEKFATVRHGRIISISSVLPAQELKPNQIPLTSNEYKLLDALPVYPGGLILGDATSMIEEIEYKISGMLDEDYLTVNE